MQAAVRRDGQTSISQLRPSLSSIIYPPTIDWHYLYQRPQQLMAALARIGYRVFFCNSTISRNLRPGMDRLAANLYLVSGRTPGPVAGPEPILWVSYPPHIHQLSRYQPGMIIFDAVDEPAEEFAHWAADVALLRARADVVFASSLKLYEAHAGLHPDVHLVPNAADYTFFVKAAKDGAIPDDLARIPPPIVGYHGALATWVDWELVNKVARANRNFSFVFIGPLFTGGECLPSGPNLHYLGHRNYHLLPNYLRGFNVGIIPFRLSPLTMACNPIKLWEYLAAGKPVVATPLPEVKGYREVYTAEDAAGFSQCLRSALAENDPAMTAARLELARNNSWDARASQIHQVLASARLRRVKA